jgi:hypothetical protein
MSATLSGLDMLKKWLDTEIYECQFRPVPLSEYLQIGTKLMDKNMRGILDFSSMPKLFGDNNNQDNVSIKKINVQE